MKPSMLNNESPIVDIINSTPGILLRLISRINSISDINDMEN